MDMVELLVRMDCTGCERTIRKALSRLKGIDSVDVDLTQNKVTVTGHVDRMKVLRAVRNTGKRAEFWNPMQQEDYHLHLANTNGYYGGYRAHSSAFTRTYNYEKHGFNIPAGHVNSQYYGRSQDEAMNVFNDDNPNACSIM